MTITKISANFKTESALSLEEVSMQRLSTIHIYIFLLVLHIFQSPGSAPIDKCLYKLHDIKSLRVHCINQSANSGI